MPSKVITAADKHRIAERFRNRPNIDFSIIAQKEGISTSCVYKTLNQVLPNWRDLKQEVNYPQNIEAILADKCQLEQNFEDVIQSQNQAESIIDRNLESDMTKIHFIRYTPTFTKREQKLLSLVIKLQQDQAQMEDRIKQLEKTVNLKQQRHQIPNNETQDEVDEIPNQNSSRQEYQNELGNQPRISKPNNQQIAVPMMEQNDWFPQKQVDSEFTTQKQKLQNRLRISLRSIPNVYKSLNESNINFTSQNRQFVISEDSIIEAFLKEDCNLQTQIKKPNYEQRNQINNEMNDVNVIDFDLKLEEQQE